MRSGHVGRRPWQRQVEALGVGHAEALDGLQLRRGLDALRRHHRVDLRGEPDERCGQRTPNGIGVDAADETDVELHDVGGETDDVAERGEPGPHVVHREASAPGPEAFDGLGQDLVVVDRDVFGELEHDPGERDALQRVP